MAVLGIKNRYRQLVLFSVENKPWIGVDLDSTLAQYDGWKGPCHIGEPIKKMVDRVKAWIKSGQEVRIFTARAYPIGTLFEDGRMEPIHCSMSLREAESLMAVRCVQGWCAQHIGKVLTVTCVKDFSMVELWDDRCVSLVPNSGEVIGGEPSNSPLFRLPTA